MQISSIYQEGHTAGKDHVKTRRTSGKYTKVLDKQTLIEVLLDKPNNTAGATKRVVYGTQCIVIACDDPYLRDIHSPVEDSTAQHLNSLLPSQTNGSQGAT